MKVYNKHMNTQAEKLQEKSLRVLEFTKIRDSLASLATTDIGGSLCRALAPLENLADAQHAQEETQEALALLTYRGDSPIVAFKDVRPSLSLAEKGAVLSTRSLLDVADCLRATSNARAALDTDREDIPILKSMGSVLTTNYHLERGIKDAIISEEEIADNASTELADIRRQMRICNDRVKDRLRTMTQSSTFSRYLQEPLVTVRNGRYVIPVRQEYRQHVPGLVHDQSSSGATLFVEPMAVVELGNELKQWALKEEREIERILSVFSASVAASSAAIATNIEVLARLDFIFAKGRLAREMHAVPPKLNDRGRIRFVQVRHPLLDPATVVPCDLWLGDGFTTLVITGPNTGGKTVTLKTVGLVTLMAQAGLHVPSKLGTEASVFGQVFADIGDEQSIEQSLSTFSSHMTNIVSIMAHVEREDLVLFDELGAGTDPTEGAALAQAILQMLTGQGIRTVATTHYSELKAFALATPGVENASVEFDVATLRPTYRLSIGVPGKSNAFDISKRLGLSDYVIDKAKDLLSHQSIRFEDVIASAEEQRQLAETEHQMARQAREETYALRKEAEALKMSIENTRAHAEKKAKEEARKILERTKRESAAILDELKLMKKSGGDTAQSIQSLQRQLQNLDDVLGEGLRKRAQKLDTSPDELNIGDTVEVPHLNTVATVLTKPDSKGEVMIQAGIIKMKVLVEQVRKSEAPKPAAKTKVRNKTSQQARSAGMSCDLRGMALDEALMEVDRYLDMAVLAGLHEVSLIHGKGTGTLRAGVQQHLKQAPQVKNWRIGDFGEGDAGVTIVELK